MLNTKRRDSIWKSIKMMTTMESNQVHLWLLLLCLNGRLAIIGLLDWDGRRVSRPDSVTNPISRSVLSFSFGFWVNRLRRRPFTSQLVSAQSVKRKNKKRKVKKRRKDFFFGLFFLCFFLFHFCFLLPLLAGGCSVFPLSFFLSSSFLALFRSFVLFPLSSFLWLTTEHRWHSRRRPRRTIILLVARDSLARESSFFLCAPMIFSRRSWSFVWHVL